MWIIWTLVCFSVLAYLGYAWIAALMTKYQHTRDSLLVLLVLGALAAFSGQRVADQVAPDWTFGPKAAIAAGVGFTIFTLFSFIAVNLWCSLLTRSFDDKITSLEDEEDAILRQLDTMRWQGIRQSEYPARSESEGGQDKARDESSSLKKTVESWEQGGGAARIRSLKVLEWREDAKSKPLDAVKKDVLALEEESRNEPDEAKREQARARAALLKLALVEREGGPAEVASPESAPKLPGDGAPSRERLQAIQSEIQSQRSAKSEFMRQRIRLSWRASK